MKKVYTAADAAKVHVARVLLEGHSIHSVVQGEALAMLSSEVPWQHAWPSLWVNDEDEQAARQLLTGFGVETHADLPAWTCPVCGEELPGQFTQCWKCARQSQESFQRRSESKSRELEWARRGSMICPWAGAAIGYAGHLLFSPFLPELAGWMMYGGITLGLLASVYFIVRVLRNSRRHDDKDTPERPT